MKKLIRCQSGRAKKILAEHLEEHDPDMLAFFKEMAEGFGALDQVEYSGPHDEELLKELKGMRNTEQSKAMAAARKALEKG